VKRTGGGWVVRALEDEEVPFTFGIPGTHNIELYDALSESDTVRPVLVTDEQAASFMADAVWRASGRLGCVNVVPGAGFTHALSGVAEAYLDTVPMLVLACGIRRDTGRAYQLHDVDQLSMAEPVTKARLRPDRGEEIYGTVREACRVARSGTPGPVMVEIPAEHYLSRHAGPGGSARGSGPSGAPGGRVTATGCGLEAREAGGAGDGAGAGGRTVGGREPRPSVARPRRVPEPDPGEVDRAVEVLSSARRPLLYLGLGAAPGGERWVRLAETLEAPVSTTFQGKGVFPESHPLWLWPGFGKTAPSFVRDVAGECDAVLAVGCRFSEVGTGSWSFEMPGPLVHVDVDGEVFHRNYEAAHAIRGDSLAFAEALLARLESEAGLPRDPDTGLRERIREGHAGVREEQLADVGGDRVTPTHLLAELQRALGPEAVYTTDSGNGTFLAMEGLRLDAPGRFLAPVDYSCMGYSVPAALGAGLARPDLPVVALAGDGAFLMTGLEILTAVRERVPVAVFVLRDRELAQISQFQDVAFHRRTASELADYDLEALCRGAGMEALRLESDDRVPEVVGEVARRLESGEPVAVEVEIDYSRKTWFTRGVVRTTVGRLPWPDRLRFVSRALWRRVTE
jgi:acetolactate synthase-1/2/3 large subunit